MKTTINPLTRRPAWKALTAHYKAVKALHLRALFAADPKRGERFTIEEAGLFLDYSKNRITGETVKLLLQLAKESGLRERMEGKIDMDFDTARRLFTLICVLHIRG